MAAKILVAAAPKSGSTFLSQILAALSGFPIQYISDAMKGGEHELSVERLKKLSAENFIAHMHTRCSIGTAKRIADFELRPIVTVRNIFDTVVSMRDHIRHADWDMPPFASPMTMAYCPANLRDVDDAELERFVIDFILPWYFSFLASWQAFQGTIPIVRYERLIDDPPATVVGALEDLNIDTDEASVRQATEMARESDTRYNVGVTGRGKHVEENEGERIRKLARYFPDADFEPFFSR